MKLKLFSTTALLILSLQSFSAEEIIKQKHYTLNYNEDHEVANWVTYDLDRSKLRNCAKRQDDFRPDPSVSTGSATAADYKNSGYDRGHLVPAGDMKFNKTAMSETFFFSNMAPQPSAFNQGRWSDLEILIRAWGAMYDGITIYTGPILRDNLPFIGTENRISVPEQYFKVILKKKGPSFEAIGFLMSTKASSKNLETYVKTVNEIEEASGHDFFSHLDDSVEEEIEGKVHKKSWDFKAKFEYFPCRP